MPEIIVHREDQVTIDGQPAGSVVDVLTNYGGHQQPNARAAQPDHRTEVHAALKAWRRGRDAEHIEERKALIERHAAEVAEVQEHFAKELEARTADFKKALAEARAKAAGDLAGRDAMIEKLRAEIETLKAGAAR